MSSSTAVSSAAAVVAHEEVDFSGPDRIVGVLELAEFVVVAEAVHVEVNDCDAIYRKRVRGGGLCLLVGFAERIGGAHHFARRFHLRAEARVGPREAVEREDDFLHAGLLGNLFRYTRVRPASSRPSPSPRVSLSGRPSPSRRTGPCARSAGWLRGRTPCRLGQPVARSSTRPYRGRGRCLR